jgi:hypothetical protein
MRLTITSGPDRMGLAVALFDHTPERPRMLSFRAEEMSYPVEVHLDGAYRVEREPNHFLLHGRLIIGNEFRPVQFIYDAARQCAIIDS